MSKVYNGDSQERLYLGIQTVKRLRWQRWRREGEKKIRPNIGDGSS